MSEQYVMPLIAVAGLDIGTRSLVARFLAHHRGCRGFVGVQTPQPARDEFIVPIIPNVTLEIKSPTRRDADKYLTTSDAIPRRSSGNSRASPRLAKF
jgi:hypothetical protein